MEKCIMAFCISSYLPWSLQELNIPEGFVGCVDDRRDRVLGQKLNRSNSNSGDECKDRCRAGGYLYAGTKFGVECYCGNSCRKCPNTTGCNIKCPGNTDEFCGGTNRLSLYDTRILLMYKTEVVTSPSTTKVSAKEDNMYLQTAVYISVPVLVIVLASIVVIIVCWRYRRVPRLKYSTYYDDTVDPGRTSAFRVDYDYSEDIHEASTDIVNVYETSTEAKPATHVKIPHSYNHVTNQPKHYKDKSYSHLKEFLSVHSLNEVNGPYMISNRNIHLQTTDTDEENIYCNEVTTMENLREEGNVVDFDYDHLNF